MQTSAHTVAFSTHPLSFQAPWICPLPASDHCIILSSDKSVSSPGLSHLKAGLELVGLLLSLAHITHGVGARPVFVKYKI